MISLDVVTPDVVSYNPAISCCGKGLQWQMALYFFSLMGLNSVTPDVITYSAAISSCEKVSNWHHRTGHISCQLGPIDQDWWTAAIWVWLMIIVVSLVVINIAPWIFKGRALKSSH